MSSRIHSREWLSARPACLHLNPIRPSNPRLALVTRAPSPRQTRSISSSPERSQKSKSLDHETFITLLAHGERWTDPCSAVVSATLISLPAEPFRSSFCTADRNTPTAAAPCRIAGTSFPRIQTASVVVDHAVVSSCFRHTIDTRLDRRLRPWMGCCATGCRASVANTNSRDESNG